MDLKRALLVFAAFCVSPGVSAATYVYTGAPYTLVQDFIAPCGAGPCANYALGEEITGQFTTAVPLAPNLSNQNVLPSVTSYSFTDGVDTYSSADPTARVDDFVASTDSSGNINAFDVMIIIWQTGTSPHTAGDRVARFRVSSSFTDIAENDAPCVVVVTAPSGVSDACVTFAPDGSTSFGDAITHGAFSILAASAPGPIPTLSGWAVLLLSLFVTTCALRVLD
jgi:hypothetical protein